MPRKQLIQQRRDTAANWTAADPTLAAGEIGFETDTGKFKVGDGSTAWSSLTYFVAGAGGSGAPTDASYVTLGTNGTLSAERVLTAGTGIDITDAGAGSTVTVDVDPSEFGNGTVPIASLASTPLLASNNLSDVTAATARTNLGLGDSATKNVGTGAGSVAAGDHNHTGVYEAVGVAAALVDDLSGVSNAATARTNLGLGDSATLSAVGASQITDGSITNDEINASAAIALSKLANITSARILGRTTAGTGPIEELAQSAVFGFLGTGTPGSGNFLRGDGTWAAATGTVDVVSNIATARVLGRLSSGSGDSEELDAEQAARLSGGVIASHSYNPATAATYTTTSASYADVDATNFAITFTAPPSGNVVLTWTTYVICGNSTAIVFNLRDSGGDVANTPAAIAARSTITNTHDNALSRSWKLTGLTAGTSYTYKLGFARAVGSSTATVAAGQSTAYGPAVCTVVAVP